MWSGLSQGRDQNGSRKNDVSFDIYWDRGEAVQRKELVMTVDFDLKSEWEFASRSRRRRCSGSESSLEVPKGKGRGKRVALAEDLHRQG